MVFELYGRSMYICNQIELRIKWLLLNKSGCGPIVFSTPENLKLKLEAVRRKKIKLCKQPLGNVWKEVLELIYKVPIQKEFDEVEAEAAKENMSVFKMDFHISSKGLLARVQKKMASVIEHRNYLAHYFAREFNLDNSTDCKKAYAKLNSKIDFLNKALEQFKTDCKIFL